MWTTAQTAQFLDSVRWHRLYAVYHLIALRGLRRGEAAGLRWCDVDLDGKTAVISQQLQQYDARLVICPPKTPHSSRVIALDRTTVAALTEHRDRQRAEAPADGPGYRQRLRVHLPERGPDGAGPAHPHLQETDRAGRAAADPAT